MERGVSRFPFPYRDMACECCLTPAATFDDEEWESVYEERSKRCECAGPGLCVWLEMESRHRQQGIWICLA